LNIRNAEIHKAVDVIRVGDAQRGGGANDGGTVFKITPSGTLTILYSFCSQISPQGWCADGLGPQAGLVQATNGNLYGTTTGGGANDSCGSPSMPYSCGAVFSLSVGLGPFVETRPTSGKVGAVVEILGTDLTGATSVSFNDTAAVFEVIATSLITTTVPTGASTGFVTVTTPSGPLTSNKEFRVTPQITSFTPPSGPGGTSVTITGISLTQTTNVYFGAVKATTFTVNSDTHVSATVPTGAATGKISITTCRWGRGECHSFHSDTVMLCLRGIGFPELLRVRRL
jgi:uncharacterized repeat protein (TIGR03803 family)